MSLSKIKVNNNSIIGVDDEPTAGSENLVKSGGIDKSFKKEDAKSLGLELEYANSNTFIPYDFVGGKKYIVKMVEASVSAVTISTWSSDKSTIIDRLQGMVLFEELEFTASNDAYYIKAGDACKIVLYEKGSVDEVLKDKGTLTLSAMAQTGVSSLLSNGQYGYNFGTNKIVYKVSNSNLVTTIPSNNLIYRYDGRLYYHNGTTLDIVPNNADINASFDANDRNIKELFSIALNKQITYKTSFVLKRDVIQPIVDYIGKDDVHVIVETDPGVSYILRATNKATGNPIPIGTITAEQNVTGTNEIFYESEGFELINLFIAGGSTASDNNTTLSLIKENLVADNIEYVNGESTTRTLTYASDRAVVDYSFRKGRKYIITNLGLNTSVFSLTNTDTLVAGTIYNRTTIAKDETVAITAAENCSYLRCGDYNATPSVRITEILLHKEIEDDILLAEIDDDRKDSYLAFNYDIGACIYPDGTYARSSSATHNSRICLTGYLPYNGGDIIARGYTNQGVNLLSFYDSSHNYLGGFFGTYYHGIVVKVKADDIPANTEYIRVTGSAKDGYSLNSNYINLSYKDNFYFKKTKQFSGIYQFGHKANGKYEPGTIQPFENAITNISAWYAMYDALVAAYPEYVSKVDCDAEYAQTAGAMARPSQLADLPIYMYKFVPYYCPANDQAPVTETNSSRFKVFICTGTHPEYMAIYDCYKLMEAICSNWQNDDNLWDLRWNCEFYIMPVSGPWGCANNSRTNYNGVDLNRNAPGSEWGILPSNPDPQDYPGASAGSEYETKVWVYFLNSINPKVFIDHHNFGGNLTVNIMYGESKQQMVRDALAAHIVEMTMRVKKEYDGITTGFNDLPLVMGYVASNQAIGCTRNKYAYEQEIISCTFETNMRFNYNNGEISSDLMPAYDTNACSVATECFSNFVIRLLKDVAIHCIPDRF